MRAQVAMGLGPGERWKGRAAHDNGLSLRYQSYRREPVQDQDVPDEADMPRRQTEVRIERPRSIITRNQSPDIGFDRSINAYRGCEHGCIYCYARPSHAWLDLSPGLDFETILTAKPDAPRLLEEALRKPGYDPAPIAMGTNTDPYQPIEGRYRITRQLLSMLDRFGHPATITTKSVRICEDMDILAAMARRNLISVNISVTTLDAALARAMEPRASTPLRRLEAVRALSAAGVPVNVFVAPVIPALTDHELESILAAAKESGAQGAGYIPLRLPYEVASMFEAWLEAHVPARATRVMHHVRAMRGGKANEPRFGHRMTGEGAYAALLASRYTAACRRLGLKKPGGDLSLAHFRAGDARQGDLFLDSAQKI